MAEDSEKGTSAWFRVPTWDGNPREWRSFKREMAWWMASLDKESCKKFNVAARWTLRQTGVVRARCEEFLPEELEATVGTYPPPEGDAAAEVDPFYGLRKLLDSLEQLNGTTELDRKGDLRAQFYQDLKRQPNERISTFCTRFRSLCGEMKREGIELPKEELGWFLRERLGLDPLRKQLLESFEWTSILRRSGNGMSATVPGFACFGSSASQDSGATFTIAGPLFGPNGIGIWRFL